MTAKNITLKITPTLLVGLGGTGKMILSEIKRQFVEHPLFGSVPPMIRFLSIDSDADPDKYQSEEEAARNLERNEKLIVTARVDSIKTFLSRQPHIRAWFPFEETRHVELTGRGAKQKRYLGRLIFFENVQEIQNRINENLSAICNRRHALASDISTADSQNIDVIVVNSLCGGTGAGMFLDLAYLLRETASVNTSKNLKMTSYFMTSEAFPFPEFKENMRRNCAASLMELDLFMQPGHPDFSVSYSDSIKINRCREARAFDICYLINGSEMPDHLTLEKTVAHSIFTGIITSAGEKVSSIIDNIQYDSREPNEKKYTSFSTWGFASCYFPAFEIKQIFKKRLARHLLDKILEKYDRADRTLSGKLNLFFHQFDAFSNRNPLDLVARWEQRVRVIPVRAPLGIQNLSREDVMPRVNWWLKQEITAEQEKRLSELMARNWDVLLGEFNEALEKHLNEYLNHYDLGIEFGYRWITEVLNRLEAFRNKWEHDLNEKIQIWHRLTENIDEIKRELKGATENFWSLISSKNINEIGAELERIERERMKVEFDRLRYEHLIESINALIQATGSETRDVLSHLRDRMWIYKDKILPDRENALLSDYQLTSASNTFVNMFVCNASEIAITGWYYGHILGLTNIEEKDEQAWDERETRCLNNIALGDNWRSFSTRPPAMLEALMQFCDRELEQLDNTSIDDYLRARSTCEHDDDEDKKNSLYLSRLRDLMNASLPVTRTDKSRGFYDAKPITILGVPNAGHTVFSPEIRDRAKPVHSDLDIKCTDIGYPQMAVMIQTLEGVPITGISTVSLWADAYENRDRYLHAVGKELNINWEEHRLVMSDSMAHLAEVTWIFFAGLESGIIKAHSRVPAGKTRFEAVPVKKKQDAFSLEEPEGTPLGNTVEGAIQHICERPERRLELERRMLENAKLQEASPDEMAAMATKYLGRLQKAVPGLRNETSRKAYSHIIKALEWHIRRFTAEAKAIEDDRKIEIG